MKKRIKIELVGSLALIMPPVYDIQLPEFITHAHFETMRMLKKGWMDLKVLNRVSKRFSTNLPDHYHEGSRSLMLHFGALMSCVDGLPSYTYMEESPVGDGHCLILEDSELPQDPHALILVPTSWAKVVLSFLQQGVRSVEPVPINEQGTLALEHNSYQYPLRARLNNGMSQRVIRASEQFRFDLRGHPYNTTQVSDISVSEAA